MTYPTWPTSVPQTPLLDSWQMPDPYQEPRVTDMEGGNVRMRSRPGDNIYRISFNILMTKAQWTTLWAWIMNDLGRGTSRFNTKIWNGSAMVNAVAQFAAKPQPSSIEPKVLVAFDLRVYPNA